MLRGELGARRGLVSVGLAALTVLVACDPVPHPEFTVRESWNSGTELILLSGDGNFAVVRASRQSATVPGAGTWRVDRRDGATVLLPQSNFGATKISRDGSRVLLGVSGQTTSLWSEGDVVAPPAGTVFSEDLTFGVFVDTDGAVKTWESATQQVDLVEPGFPRPPGTISAAAKGISDDGRTVHYELNAPQLTERFVDLDAARAIDRPNLTSSTFPFAVTDQFALAATGDAFIHAHGEYQDLDGSLQVDEAWAELVPLPLGTASHRSDITSDVGVIRESILIADDGKIGWIYSEGTAPCPGPVPSPCTYGSSVVAIRARGHRAFDTGPGQAAGIDISSTGRMLVVAKQAEIELSAGPEQVRVIDWITGNVEVLDQGESF